MEEKEAVSDESEMKWLLSGLVGLQVCTLSKDAMKPVLLPADLTLRGVQPGGWNSAAGVSQPSAKIRVRGVQEGVCLAQS